MKKPAPVIVPKIRRLFVFSIVLAMSGMLVARAVDLHVRDRDFLQNQGEARQHRVVSVPAHRGMILDRNGEPLAISTPVDTLWAEPLLLAKSTQLSKLAKVLEISTDGLKKKLANTKSRQFAYLRRHVDPQLSGAALALKIDGVHVQREYRRYYPAGEVLSHVLGFTNVDDNGQEGLELAYNDWLQGKSGARRVIRDRLGRAIEDIESIRPARPGKDLTLSIDKRLQYVAYRELQIAVQKHQARSASAVVLDVNTGEVLAMVNQPSYNPNRRSGRSGRKSHNRAVISVLEPGSTMKPITLAAALESGDYQPEFVIETAPGYYRVGKHQVRDHRNYGDLDFTGILQHSSNVGASKIALSLDPQQMWSVYDRFGFGRVSGSGFPGEVTGTLNHASQWRKIEQATMSFGYGLSVTPLQLARAYSAIANDGVLAETSFIKIDKATRVERVISADTAKQVRAMLESVTQLGGSGTRAKVAGYRVGGKTGTAWKSESGGYAENRYIALFAGFAPLSRPEIVVIVAVDEPNAGEFYGGVVAAPVFAKITASALRLRGTLPDDWNPSDQRVSSLQKRWRRRMMTAESLSTIPTLADLLVGFVPPQSLINVAIVRSSARIAGKVAPGYLFFALEGASSHGLDYFDSVVEAGACAVLVDVNDSRCNASLRLLATNAGVVLQTVENLPQRVGEICARFFDYPSKELCVVGVTGTDGKTSVTQFIANALHSKKSPSGVIGTLGSGVVGELIDTGLTTPDAVSVQTTLAGFRDSGIAQVAMEVSSHAVSQGRANGVEFDVTVLTNLGRDHLDYHGSVENYHNAKLQLLQGRSAGAVVLNVDDENVRRHLGTIKKGRRICYASESAYREIADVFADDISLSARGIELTVVTANNRLSLKSSLIGRFNVSNLLATFASLRALGFDERDIAERLSNLNAVAGRAECFSAPGRARAVVDYSHTPQSLEAILRSIREHCSGTLWCVFGCGGDRDKGKRPLMAAAAEKYADRVILTDDNPRTEDGNQIIKDAMAGFSNCNTVLVERDRKAAILKALDNAVADDWVVVAGKGHEDYQVIGTKKIHLSDRKIVSEALAEVTGV